MPSSLTPNVSSRKMGQAGKPKSAPAHLSFRPERWKSSVFLCARTSRRNRKLPVCQPRPLIQVDCKVLTLRGGRTNQDQSRACEFFSVASVQRHFDSGAASGLHIQVQECLPQGWFGQSAYSVRWPPTVLRTSQSSKFELVFALGGPHPCAEVVADAFCAFQFRRRRVVYRSRKVPLDVKSFAQRQQPTPRDRELQRNLVCAADREYSIDLRQ